MSGLAAALEAVVAGRAITETDRAELAWAAELLAPLCLVGWDTGGEPWLP